MLARLAEGLQEASRLIATIAVPHLLVEGVCVGTTTRTRHFNGAAAPLPRSLFGGGDESPPRSGAARSLIDDEAFGTAGLSRMGS